MTRQENRIRSLNALTVSQYLELYERILDRLDLLAKDVRSFPDRQMIFSRMLANLRQTQHFERMVA